MNPLQQNLQISDEIATRASAAGYLGYLDSVVIDSRPHPKRFWPNADPWQRELNTTLVNRLEAVAGLPGKDHALLRGTPSRFWWVLPRGHDKSSAIGRALNYVLAFPRTAVRASVAAADRDQAAIITELMKAEANHNPWLSRRLDFRPHEVRGMAGSRLTVCSSDSPTAWGKNEDLYILDEVTWWKNDKLWIALASAFHKRPGTVVLIISNAGELGSWQHKAFVEAKKDPAWSVFEAPEGKPLATWMDMEQRAKDYKMIPLPLARRVFDNVWIDPAEVGGYLTMKEAQACEDKTLPIFNVQPIRGVRYLASIDYGPKRDRTALCLGHYDDATGMVVVDRLDVWQGSPDAPIQISAVEKWLDELTPVFRPDIVLDPYQMEGTAQKFEHNRLVHRFEARGGKSNYELAECLRSLVVNRQIRWHPDHGRLTGGPVGQQSFAEELSRLVIRPTSYGYRFDHLSGHHDDRAVAVGQLAHTLVHDKTKGSWVSPQTVGEQVPSATVRTLIDRTSMILKIKKGKNFMYGVNPKTGAFSGRE